VSYIVERFQRICRDRPDRPLVHVPAESATLTTSDILSASDAHVRALDRLGLGRDSLVMLAIGNRPAAFPFWIAARRRGIAVMPVDAGVTRVETADLARRFGASAVIVPESHTAASSIGSVVPYGCGLAAIRVNDAVPRPELCAGAAILKLTSGSTGLPKATFTTDREVVIDTEHIVTAMGITPSHTQLAAIPLSHAYGLGNLLMPALLQGTAVVLRESFVPQAIASDARDYGANVFPGVPFMFEHLVISVPAASWPRGLHRLMSAGARLEAATARRFHDAFGVKIHSFYGTSETGGIAYDDTDEVSDETTVGRPMPDVVVTLRPEEGARDDEGRVHVASGAVATRYVGERPSDGAFGDGGFLTGDFGRFDGRGHLVLTGRVSAFINVAGRKVQPEEVEQVLRTMPGVADVRVLGAADPARGEQIVACIVRTDGDRNVLAVRRFCAARLAPYKLPRAVIWLDRIPITERGKTDRAALERIVVRHLAGA
jgi:long-chain acyl-CoA synthetase